MQRFIQWLLISCSLVVATQAQMPPQSLNSIAFGSCSHQDKEQPILNTVVQQHPEVFIYLGDNIYGDTEDMAVLQAKYDQLADKPEFQQLRNSCRVLATWDDHDYGKNDAGKEYPKKAESKEIFLNFWGEPKDSERWQHKGIYHSQMFTGYAAGKRTVQVILLDNRTFRTPLKRRLRGYKRLNNKDATMLGAEQWAWLEQQLLKPADVRIIATSTQFAAEHNGYEAWANMPLEQQKMIELIQKTKANGVVFISGDTHWADLSKMDDREEMYPLYDLTSSGLTQTWHKMSANKYRVGAGYRKNNFGMLRFNWHTEDPEITFQIYNTEGEVVLEYTITLSQISFQN